MHYRQAVAFRPAYFEALASLGNVLRGQGKFDASAACFEQLLALRPEDAAGALQPGPGPRLSRPVRSGRGTLSPSATLRPDSAVVHNSLGVILAQQKKLDEAQARFEQAVALRPDLAEPYNNLGNVLRERGQLEQAATRYRHAIALRPDYAEAHNNLGNIRWEQGKFDEATTHYRQALAFLPNLAEARYRLAELTTFHAGDADLAALEALAADSARLPSGDRIFVEFALGKAFDDIGDYERAFQHWLRGNAQKRREMEFDEAAWLQKTVPLVVQTFDSALFDRFAAVGDPSPVPIFVLGMPRSGSTLVEQILASHPQVQAAGELQNLDRVARSAPDFAGRPVRFPHWVRTADAGTFRRLGQAYLASLPPLAAGQTRLTDKMPSNFVYAGLIRLALPGARIIHTLRDPVDTCLSCFSRLFDVGPSFTYNLAELGRSYRLYHELMAHWRAVLPAGAMLEVAYEDVIDDLEQQARRLLDYCGLPWDDRCVSFHQNNRPIKTSSNVQVRRPLYRSSLARWRRYEPFLQPLLAELEGCRPPAR